MRCSWEAPRLPSLIFSCPRARPPAQPRQRRDLLEERLDRQRRRAADFLTRWNIAHDAALSRNTGPSAKRQMTGNTGLARQDDMIVKPGAPGNSRLRDHNAPGTKLHGVSDLNQIIDHGAAANDRIRTSTAIDRGVRSDLQRRLRRSLCRVAEPAPNRPDPWQSQNHPARSGLRDRC